MLEKLTKNLLPVAIVIAAVIIGGVLVYTNQVKINKGNEGVLTSQVAGEKAIDYINKNLLSGGVTASLVSAGEENELYKIKLKVQDKEYDSYITKDGSLFFPEGIKIVEESQKPAENNSGKTEGTSTCENVNKANKSILEAFVVSNCPYGLQMQRVLYEIVKNIPSLEENIKVKYIGAIENGKITSMHGDAEAQENLRQICIREEQENKYWNYVGCYLKKGETDNCLTSAGIDKIKLNTCVADSSKGLNYAQNDFTVQNSYQVSGSPTLFLNGKKVSEFDFGGRTAEAVKTIICCGFNTAPGVCSQKLTTDQAATSFSETYASSSGSSSSGGCQ